VQAALSLQRKIDKKKRCCFTQHAHDESRGLRADLKRVSFVTSE